MADFVAQRRIELYGKERNNKTEAENLKKVLESTHVLKNSGEYNYDPRANTGIWQSSHSLDFKVSIRNFSSLEIRIDRIVPTKAYSCVIAWLDRFPTVISDLKSVNF